MHANSALASLVPGLLLSVFTTAAVASPLSANGLEQRQTSNPCSIWTSSTQLNGDGAPRQKYLHKQLSQVVTCSPENTCTVGASVSQSYTIGASISGEYSWISGGFDVSQSWETGNTYDCDGEGGQSICIWQKIAHTEYDVEFGSYNACTGFSKSGDGVIASPNNNNAGGGYYCVVGSCRNQGDAYWE